MAAIEILYQRKIGSPLVERVLVLLSTVYSVALRSSPGVRRAAQRAVQFGVLAKLLFEYDETSERW